MEHMKAVVFRGPNRLAIEERPKPVPGPGQAVIEITMTTICGTDVNIVKGEYPVRPGLVLGHEPVGVIEALGEGLEGATPEEVLKVPNDFYQEMGLDKVLTSQRLNGMSAILAHMKRLALAGQN